MGKRLALDWPLAQPGPHGYPMRFGVRCAGPGGYKIFGAYRWEPVRYIEHHTHRFILHHSAHKKPPSPPLVTVHENWAVGSEFPKDDHKPTYSMIVHGQEDSSNGRDGARTDGPSPTTDLIINLTHTHCRPVTFQFQLAIPTTNPFGVTTTTLETFEWRRATTNCHETRGIRSKKLPALKTGDPRPPPEKHVWFPNGSILVRLRKKKNNNNNNNNNTTTPTTTLLAEGLQLLGFTPQREEILASYTTTRDYHTHIYFQFWGSAARGELGETFTHLAVASGIAVWKDEWAEKNAGGGVVMLGPRVAVLPVTGTVVFTGGEW